MTIRTDENETPEKHRQKAPYSSPMPGAFAGSLAASTCDRTSGLVEPVLPNGSREPG